MTFPSLYNRINIIKKVIVPLDSQVLPPKGLGNREPSKKSANHKWELSTLSHDEEYIYLHYM